MHLFMYICIIYYNKYIRERGVCFRKSFICNYLLTDDQVCHDRISAHMFILNNVPGLKKNMAT